MKLYCHIKKTINENGEDQWVINEGPCVLPENANNISNLNVLDDENLKLFGWVPVETISDNKDVVVSTEFEVFDDKVIEHITTRDKTEEELNKELEDQKTLKWIEVRKQRDLLLLESDKLVLIDRWEKLSSDEKISLTNYRQSLRDLPQSNSNPESIVFPTL